MKQINFIFFHGWGLSPSSYRPFLKELRKKGAVITPKINLRSLDQDLNEIGKIINKQVIIIAHSCGAAPAMAFENKFPSKVKKVILLCPPGFADNSLYSYFLSWFKHLPSFFIMPKAQSFLIMSDFFRTSFLHPFLSFFEAKQALGKISALSINDKYRILFAKDDQLVPVPNKSSLKYETVNGDHYWFIKNPNQLIKIL